VSVKKNLYKSFFIGIIFVVLLCAFAKEASALATPSQGRYDSRIRTVNYNPDNITLINGHFGFTTHIQFDAAETVTDVAMGDPTAWAVEVRENHIFLKPVGKQANTNMSVLTTRRVYIFDLRAYQQEDDKSKFFLVNFKYPEEEQARKEQEGRDRQLREKLNIDSEPTAVNWNYYKAGTELIAPTEVFDDNTFTYLTFPNNRDFPAVFRKYPDGSEALLNSHVHGNRIVIHSIEQKLVLRRGNQVALIFNGSFNPDGFGVDSGMTVRGFQRVVRAGDN